MEIFVVRHGTTEWNRKRKIQGGTDIPLDDKGILMAEMSGQTMLRQGITFDHVFSSPLSRAYETARLLVPYLDVVKDDRLSELVFGEFEGGVSDEMLSSNDSPFRFFRTDPVRYNELAPSHGGESLESLVARTTEFMKEVIEPLASTCKRVLISGHGALNRGLLMYVRGTNDLSDYWGMGLQVNCGITPVTLDIVDGTPRYGTPGECVIYYDESLKVDPELLLKK